MFWMFLTVWRAGPSDAVSTGRTQRFERLACFQSPPAEHTALACLACFQSRCPGPPLMPPPAAEHKCCRRLEYWNGSLGPRTPRRCVHLPPHRLLDVFNVHYDSKTLPGTRGPFTLLIGVCLKMHLEMTMILRACFLVSQVSTSFLSVAGSNRGPSWKVLYGFTSMRR
jgi:hypothetical protein